MSRINTPINQVRLTNVATVRMSKGGKRFEIACYRNKVVNYRQGVETDLSEVLQTERVFTNVSKGEFAKSKDLAKVFGTSDEEEISKLILEKGDLQVSDLERTQQIESVSRDIATWISEHCVHPVTQRPYTIPQIRQAMKQAEYTIHPSRSLKKQYLDCYKRMEEKGVIQIVRAKMQLQLVYLGDMDEAVKQTFDEHNIHPSETSKEGDSVVATLLVDPSRYRVLEDLSKKVSGRLEILKQVVMREGDSNIEEEMRENQQYQDQHRKDETTRELQDVAQKVETQLKIDAQPTLDVVDEIVQVDKDDEDEDYVESFNSRKSQKKAQKKSKKAKRREKEEAAERQARIGLETKRREDRAEMMGTTTSESTAAGSGEGGKPCNTCGGSFPSMTDYRAHFRSDWHRYNIKLKMKGAATVSEEEFRLCDSDAFFDGMM